MNGPTGKLDLRRGERQLSGTLRDGALDGVLRIEEQERPQASLSYRQGVLHGPFVLLHPNGRPAARMTYQDGKLHGPATFHAPEGWLQRQANYRAGMLHGEVKTFFADGGLAELQHYHAGQLHGLQQRFHPGGQLAWRQLFQQGQGVEPERSFGKDGRPRDEQGKPISRLAWWWQRLTQVPE